MVGFVSPITCVLNLVDLQLYDTKIAEVFAPAIFNKIELIKQDSISYVVY